MKTRSNCLIIAVSPLFYFISFYFFFFFLFGVEDGHAAGLQGGRSVRWCHALLGHSGCAWRHNACAPQQWQTLGLAVERRDEPDDVVERRTHVHGHGRPKHPHSN